MSLLCYHDEWQNEKIDGCDVYTFTQRHVICDKFLLVGVSMMNTFSAGAHLTVH